MTRQIFDKSASEYPRREIPNGCADIAEMLGHKPQNTLWDDSVVYHPASLRFMNKADGFMQQGITIMGTGPVTVLTLGLDPAFLEYQQRHAGVTAKVVQLTPEPPRTDTYAWPDHSIPQHIKKKASEDPDLRQLFNGKVYCPRMPYEEMKEVITELGGKTLMEPEGAFRFNSKVRTATQAVQEGYNVAPYVVAYDRRGLETGIAALSEMSEKLGIPSDKAKYWIKFDGLAGGDGVMPFRPAEQKFEQVRDWVDHVLHESEAPKGHFIPLLMDIDVGILPGVKRVLGNLNVQGVAGEEKAYITGTTFQRTENGLYMGGTLARTEEERALAREAQDWGAPVLSAAQRQGYRGYAGIDVLMCEMLSGEHVGFILEMNGRLNSSTSLQATAQRVGREAGLGRAAEAFNISAHFPSMKNFGAFERGFGDLLYKGAESGHAGVVPTMLYPDKKGDLAGVKTIAVAPDQDTLVQVEKRFTGRVRSIGGH